ncbi:hypothetical protein [Streptomyces sp. AM8-1-1]|uniref:hypothetical protein n=1 Tax=Streptomyces sp. AM8-1-1 TaxID=3075825 RepID=UPI0028C3D2B0|nr:hypothetical protein [Streptomyces sp. AM8-1-1]WNO70462.1 hypothetical protein RPQ07_01970 [Streptomyces sp. AM8-1-1]
MSKAVKVGLWVVGVLVVLVVAGLGIGGYLLYDKLDEGSITEETYASIQVGQAESDVVRQLPRQQSDLAMAAVEETPAPPKGADCRYHAAKIDAASESVPVHRFCFAGGKLTEKTTLE